MAGTSFEQTFSPFVNTNVVPSLTDINGYVVFGRMLTSTLPTDVNTYEEGCILICSGNGLAYINSGTVAAPSFTQFDTGTSFALPIAAIDASTTTGTSFSLTTSAVTTGNAQNIIAAAITTGNAYKATLGTSLTTGGAFNAALGAAVTGYALTGLTTGVYTGAGLIQLTANSATTGTLGFISGTGLTSGSAFVLTGGGANMTAGGQTQLINMGAATTGQGLQITSTGVYAGLNGIFQATANSATTGTITRVNGTGLTSGIANQVVAAAATLTTGRYYSANDGGLEVFGIGANGHIHTNQTTPPTVATNATGLSAVAVTAGSTDVAGTITSTGTPASGTVITLTFAKTYTTAPKVVLYTPANAAAGGVNTMPIVTQTATTAVFTWPAGGTYAATPSWTYLVVA